VLSLVLEMKNFAAHLTRCFVTPSLKSWLRRWV